MTGQDPSLLALCGASQQAAEPQRDSEGLSSEAENTVPESTPAEASAIVRCLGDGLPAHSPSRAALQRPWLQTQFSDFSYMVRKPGSCWAVCLAWGIHSPLSSLETPHSWVEGNASEKPRATKFRDLAFIPFFFTVGHLLSQGQGWE